MLISYVSIFKLLFKLYNKLYFVAWRERKNVFWKKKNNRLCRFTENITVKYSRLNSSGRASRRPMPVAVTCPRAATLPIGPLPVAIAAVEICSNRRKNGGPGSTAKKSRRMRSSCPISSATDYIFFSDCITKIFMVKRENVFYRISESFY